MTDIVIVAAARTAVGKFGGTLSKTPAPELGAAVIANLLERAKLTGDQIGEVILGQVLAAGSGQNPARQAVVKSGLPQSRFSVSAPLSCGSPPFTAATRDRYMSFASVWITLPNTHWPIRAGSTFERATASRTTRAASSVGGMSFSEPP
jgi:hypothetical protein